MYHKVPPCRAAMLSTLHTGLFPDFNVHHIYTSLVKICTLHITVHTSHQLLANTRTLMKPKTTALKQAGGAVLPLWGSFFGLHILTRHCFPEGQVKVVNQIPEMDLQLFFLLQQLLRAACLHASSGCLGFCWDFVSAASFLHLHVCLDGAAPPSGASVLLARQTNTVTQPHRNEGGGGREGILHLATTFHAFPSGEREAVPAKACLQSYLKLDLDTAGCWAWQPLCTAGARAERGNSSGPHRCFWSLGSAGFLLSSRF